MKCQNILIVLVRATELDRVAHDCSERRETVAMTNTCFFSIALLRTTQRCLIANYLILRRILQKRKQPNSKDAETKKFALYLFKILFVLEFLYHLAKSNVESRNVLFVVSFEFLDSCTLCKDEMQTVTLLTASGPPPPPPAAFPPRTCDECACSLKTVQIIQDIELKPSNYNPKYKQIIECSNVHTAL